MSSSQHMWAINQQLKAIILQMPADQIWPHTDGWRASLSEDHTVWRRGQWRVTMNHGQQGHPVEQDLLFNIWISARVCGGTDDQ